MQHLLEVIFGDIAAKKILDWLGALFSGETGKKVYDKIVEPRASMPHYTVCARATIQDREHFHALMEEATTAGVEDEMQKVLGNIFSTINDTQDQDDEFARLMSLGHNLAGLDVRARNRHWRDSTGSEFLREISKMRNDLLPQFIRRWGVGEIGDILVMAWDWLWTSRSGRAYLWTLAVSASLLGILTIVHVTNVFGFSYWTWMEIPGTGGRWTKGFQVGIHLGIWLGIVLPLIILWHEFYYGREDEWLGRFCFLKVCEGVLTNLLLWLIPDPMVSSLVLITGAIVFALVFAPIGIVLVKFFTFLRADDAYWKTVENWLIAIMVSGLVVFFLPASIPWTLKGPAILLGLVVWLAFKASFFESPWFKVPALVGFIVCLLLIVARQYMPISVEAGLAAQDGNDRHFACRHFSSTTAPRLCPKPQPPVMPAPVAAVVASDDSRRSTVQVIKLLAGVESEVLPKHGKGTELAFSGSPKHTKVCYHYGLKKECRDMDETYHGIKHFDWITFVSPVNGVVVVTITLPRENV